MLSLYLFALLILSLRSLMERSLASLLTSRPALELRLAFQLLQLLLAAQHSSERFHGDFMEISRLFKAFLKQFSSIFIHFHPFSSIFIHFQAIFKPFSVILGSFQGVSRDFLGLRRSSSSSKSPETLKRRMGRISPPSSGPAA